uniref:Transmembrane 9 superfamily member n=1 Tax=Oryza nivara TaxID=4536 RepID=A0A0E0IP15_ORYNI
MIRWSPSGSWCRSELSPGSSTPRFLTAATTTWQSRVRGLPGGVWDARRPHRLEQKRKAASATAMTAAGMPKPSHQPARSCTHTSTRADVDAEVVPVEEGRPRRRRRVVIELVGAQRRGARLDAADAEGDEVEPQEHGGAEDAIGGCIKVRDGEEEEDCGATTQVGVGNECADERGEEAGARPRRHVPGGDDIALPDHAGELTRFLAMPANARQSLSSVPRISRHALQPPQPLSSSLPPAFGRRR